PLRASPCVPYTTLFRSLQRAYAHPSNAVSSARKWAETLFDEATCERLEAAWMPTEDGGARVYMRIRAEGQRPFVAPDDEPEEERSEEHTSELQSREKLV